MRFCTQIRKIFRIKNVGKIPLIGTLKPIILFLIAIIIHLNVNQLCTIVRNLNYSVISFLRFVKQVNADSTWQKKKKDIAKTYGKIDNQNKNNIN